MDADQHLQASLSSFDFARFLHFSLQQIRARNPRFSMRALARSVGVSPACISLVMQGKRTLTEDAGARLAKLLKLDAAQTRFLIEHLKYTRGLRFQSRIVDEHLRLETDHGDHCLEQAFLRIFEHPKALLLGERPYVSDLSRDFERVGLEARAVQTWVLPPLGAHQEAPYSLRYDPDSAFYQTLMGILSVRSAPGASEWSQAAHIIPQRSLRRLAEFLVSGQHAWITTSRAPAHTPKLVEDTWSVESWDDGYFLVRFTTDTLSDMGQEEIVLPEQPRFSVVAHRITPFHPVRLHGVALIKCDPETKAAAVIFSNAAEFHDRDGKHHRPTARHMWKLLSLLDRLRMKDFNAKPQLNPAPYVPL